MMMKPWMAIALLAVLFLSRFLFGGEGLFPYQTLRYDMLWRSLPPADMNADTADIAVVVYPPIRMYNQALHEGRWQHWDPTMLGGIPLGQSTNVAVYYPLNILFHRVLDVQQAEIALLLVHLILAGIGMYTLARALDMDEAAALVSACTWMLAGPVTCWALYDGYQNGAVAWAPWVMWGQHQHSVSGRLRPALLGGLALGMALLASYTNLSYYLCLFLTAYGIYRIVSDKVPWSRILIGLAVISAVGVAFAAPNTLLQLEMASHSQRANFNFGDLAGLSAPLWNNLLRLISPYALGHPGLGFYMRPNGMFFFETCVYMGTLPLILALGAVRRKGLEAFMVAAAAVVLMCVSATWVYYPFFELLPLMKKFIPTRIGFLFAFVMALAAGLGAARLSLPRFRLLLAIPLGVSVVLCIVCASFQSDAGPYLPILRWMLPYSIYPPVEGMTPPHQFAQAASAYYRPANLYLLLPGLVALAALMLSYTRLNRSLWVVLIAADLMLFGLLYYPPSPRTEPPVPPAIAALQQQSGEFRILRNYPQRLANATRIFGQHEIEGFASLYDGRYSRLMSEVETRFRTDTRIIFGNAIRMSGYRSPTIDMLNVRYILFDTPPEDPMLTPLGTWDGLHVMQNQRATGHVWFVTRAKVGTPQEVDQAVVDPSFNPSDLAWLESPPPFPIDAPPAPSTVRIESRTSDTLTATVDCTQNGIAIISQVLYPGWKATVDGTPTALLRVNGFLPGIALPPGHHTITLRYEPTGHWPGVALSLLTLTLCAVVIVYRR